MCTSWLKQVLEAFTMEAFPLRGLAPENTHIFLLLINFFAKRAKKGEFFLR